VTGNGKHPKGFVQHVHISISARRRESQAKLLTVHHNENAKKLAPLALSALL
jgi:hypothetical protein